MPKHPKLLSQSPYLIVDAVLWLGDRKECDKAAIQWMGSNMNSARVPYKEPTADPAPCSEERSAVAYRAKPAVVEENPLADPMCPEMKGANGTGQGGAGQEPAVNSKQKKA